MSAKFVLLDWKYEVGGKLISENRGNVQSISTITEPRKDFTLYKRGDFVKAKWRGSLYNAERNGISGK